MLQKNKHNKFSILFSFFTLLFVLLFNDGFSQVNKKQNNSIGISVPIIWNNSNGVYYSLGSRKEPMGKSVSYGININYRKVVYKGWFGGIGAGYFKQAFNICLLYTSPSPRD